VNQAAHATTADLLALRDGEGGAWTRRHVETCAACAAELYRLDQLRARLRALPALAPPRDRWPAVAGAARAERRRRWSQSVAGLAAAAVLAVVTVVSLRPDAPAPDRAALGAAALQEAMARSQALEQALRALSPERRSLGGAAAGVVADLEDRLAELDAELSEPGAWGSDGGRVVELWKQRAGILSALVDVHVTRAALAGL
jgi:hypothetical protein